MRVKNGVSQNVSEENSFRIHQQSQILDNKFVQKRIKNLENLLYQVNSSLIDDKILDSQMRIVNKNLYAVLSRNLEAEEQFRYLNENPFLSFQALNK